MTITETWEQRRDREHREELEKITTFYAKLESMNIDGWQIEPLEILQDGLPNSFRLNHGETGASIWIEAPVRYSARHGKVGAAATWPRNSDGQHMSARDWGLHGYNESDPYRIGFSYKKTAKAIQRDLERRLIPGVLAGIAEVNAKLAAQRDSKAGIQRDLDRVLASFRAAQPKPGKVDSHSAAFWFRNGSGTIRSNSAASDTDGNTVCLELNYLPVSTALKIAKLLAK